MHLLTFTLHMLASSVLPLLSEDMQRAQVPVVSTISRCPITTQPEQCSFVVCGVGMCGQFSQKNATAAFFTGQFRDRTASCPILDSTDLTTNFDAMTSTASWSFQLQCEGMGPPQGIQHCRSAQRNCSPRGSPSLRTG